MGGKDVTNGRLITSVLIGMIICFGLLGCNNPTGGGGGGSGSTIYSLTTYVTTEVVTTEIVGTIEVFPAGSQFPRGTLVTLEASTLEAAYMFKRWTGGITGENSQVSFVMNSSKVVTAEFTIKPPANYLFSAFVSPEGAGTVEPWSSVYTAGTNVLVTAEEYGLNTFDHWELDATGSSNPYTITMNNTKEVRAVFNPPRTLTVMATPDSYGMVWPTSETLADKDSVTLIATAEPGYKFVSWEGDVSGTQNPKTITMDGNKTIFARFRALYNYSLNISVTPEGFGTVEPWGGTFTEGSNVLLTADAYSGQEFASWEGDVNSTSNPVIITMDGNKNITARFKTWQNVGNAGFSAGVAGYTSLYVYEGTPYVAYEDYVNGNKATVMKFNGTNWETVGNAGFSSGQIANPSMDTVNISLYVYAGTPYVAYADNANNSKATVMKLNGTNWETVGNAGFSTGTSEYISLCVYAGTPYVAYAYSDTNGADGGRATVMEFNGTTWETVGNAGFSDGVANFTSLYIYNGIPYVAYKDDGNGGKATVMEFNGTTWETVGNAGFSPGYVAQSTLSFYNSTPYVAFADGSSDSNPPIVMSFNSTNWETVGSAIGYPVGSKKEISFSFDNGMLYELYDLNSDQKATVARLNGTNWETVGNSGFSSGEAWFLSLYVYNGTPYVAYSDQLMGWKATVMKYGP